MKIHNDSYTPWSFEEIHFVLIVPCNAIFFCCPESTEEIKNFSLLKTFIIFIIGESVEVIE